tara:strand:- start:2088 stop:2588 length:501 start_codon:yes stop_codon:yes gene_type:complete
MKKLLLVVLVLLGLQTQAQITYCDSISYTTLPQQTLTVVGDASGLSNLLDSIVWSWSVCNSTMCYSGSGQTATFQNILSTDTVKVCYDLYIYFMGATYICTDCDSLVYDANSYSWILLNIGNPTSINELTLEIINDNKIYDMLGRELSYIPTGTMYIQNRKIYYGN